MMDVKDLLLHHLRESNRLIEKKLNLILKINFNLNTFNSNFKKSKLFIDAFIFLIK